jgi:hypothetical protein
MGLGEASESPDSTTAWLDYAPRSFDLEPGMAEVHTFVVSVPEGTLPGQYITSIVVQAADAQRITSPADGVSLGAVTRHGMAVAITVPGQATPAMAIGAANHILSTDHSVVSIAVENTGYTRLKPTGEFVLTDGAGVELTRFPVTMGLLYAQTATTVEIPFATMLNPGTYIVSLALTEATHDLDVRADSLTLIVEEPVSPVAPDGTPQVATVDQQPSAPADTSAAAATDTNGGSATMLVAVGAVAGCLVVGIIAGGTLIVRRRTTAASPHGRTSAATDPPATTVMATSAAQRLATVTQRSPRSTVEQDQ